MRSKLLCLLLGILFGIAIMFAYFAYRAMFIDVYHPKPVWF